MSLRAFEGFDHYGTNSDLLSREGALTWTFQQTMGVLSGQATDSRFNYGQYYTVGQNTRMYGNFNISMSVGCVGFAMRMGTSGNSNGAFLFLDTSHPPGAVTLGSVGFASLSGQMWIADHTGATIASSPNGVFPSGTWFFLDIKFTPGNPGSMSVRLENQPVAGLTGVSGNFASGSSNTFNEFAFSTPVGVFGVDVDDFHYNDCTSTDPGTYPNNDFMGDTRALALYPTSDFSVSWTKSTPQFLDTNTVGGSSSTTTIGHNVVQYYKIVPTHTARLNQILFDLNATYTGHAVAGIYTDVNGAPGVLLAQSAPITNAVVGGFWYGFDLSAAALTIHKNVPYWVALNTDQNFFCTVYLSQIQASQPLTYTGTLPASANTTGPGSGIGAAAAIGMIAVANYQNVGENIFDGDESYNYTTTIGAEDLFNCDSLVSTTLNILAVQVIGAYRKDDAQQHTLTQRVRSGTTDVGGHVIALSSSWFYSSDIYPTDPATGASWSVSGVNTMQVGYRLES
jgi:hypothetical protein